MSIRNGDDGRWLKKSVFAILIFGGVISIGCSSSETSVDASRRDTNLLDGKNNSGGMVAGAIATGENSGTGGATSTGWDALPWDKADGGQDGRTDSRSPILDGAADRIGKGDSKLDLPGDAQDAIRGQPDAERDARILLDADASPSTPEVAPVCTVPTGVFKSNLAVGGGGSTYKESDHFVVINGGASADAALNHLEAAHQCFIVDWCWRSPGLSITESSGTFYKLNLYGISLSGAAGVMQYDRARGLSYLEVVPNSVGNVGVVVHELGHAFTLAEKGWVEQGRTGLWWESVANFVSDTFQTSPFCAKARSDRGIATGRTIIDLNANIGNSFQVIVMNGNHYQAWPFLAFLTYNPDQYPGLGRMVLPQMFRTHKGNNETPLHVLERLSAPVKVQTIVGRYWARMAFVDIGHPSAQEVFLSNRSRLNYANLTSVGNGVYTPLEARRPRYSGANIIPLKLSGSTVRVQITNEGNGQADSNFTATLAMRSTVGGAIRYVDLPKGVGEATMGSNEEATLVVANTPDTLYLYDPSNLGANDPANAGLYYRLQLTGATPTF